MTDLERMIERVELEMVEATQIALREHPGTRRTAYRTAAAEWAVIASALRTQSTDSRQSEGGE